MTNSNDFRRYSYQYDTSYMIKDFNLSRSSAAPKHTETPSDGKKLKLRENKTVKSSEQIQYIDVQKYKAERMEKIKNERLNQTQSDSGNN